MLSFPLERDEGEYAYAGQLILQGIPPYTLAYNMKLPGVYAAYALLQAVFGQSTNGIHWGLLCVNAATILLVFALARRLFGPLAGIIAAFAYALLSTSESVLGLAAHATHFVVLPALGGALLLLRSDERPRAWLDFSAGVLLGLAFLMKQHGAVFVAFGLAYAISAPMRQPPRPWWPTLLRTTRIAAGAVLPFALTCLVLSRAGAFDRFWFWTVSYARAYASEVSWSDARQFFVFGFSRVVAPSPWLWILAGAGLLTAWSDTERRREAVFLTAFLAFSVLGVFPGFYFREHYFILVLPAVAILAGAVVAWSARFLASKRVPAPLCYGLAGFLFLAPASQSLLRQKELLLERTPEQACRETYGANPFPEAIEISKYIASHSKPEDRVAVLGSEPEIYFYARRRSATGHIYMYGLMEQQPYARRMQQEMIREIEASRPEYIVFVNIPTSWLARQESEMLLLDWYSRYQKEHYTRVGVIDVPAAGGEAVYHWNEETQAYAPRSPYVISVYRRNGDG